MTRYFVSVEGEQYVVTVADEGPLKVDRVDDSDEVVESHELDLQLQDVYGSEFALCEGAAQRSVAMMREGHEVEVLFSGEPALTCEVYDEQSRALSGGVKQQGELFIKSPMPGIVLDVKVKEGQQVAEGETLLILEAMKTENEICAQLNARVAKVHVESGQTIQDAALLIELEELSESS